MSSQWGSIEITCDAPIYPVVQACERLGFRNPLDVRWHHLGRRGSEKDGQGRDAGAFLWWWFTRKSPARKIACSCGEPLPVMQRYTFKSMYTTVAEYNLGQCRRCLTIFWEVAKPEQADATPSWWD